MKVLTLDDIDVRGKRVLVREDLNVPIKEGFITSDQRLQAALPTLQSLLERGASVVVCSHLGRPEEGGFDKRYSLQPVADYLAEHLSVPVRLSRDYLNGLEQAANEVILCENLRFNVGEKANDEALARKLAALCDVFVMDAFGTAHRAHASTCGVARFAPVAVAGPLLVKELAAIAQALAEPEPPIVAIVGGSKISSKLTLLRHMIEKVDVLIVGGGIANTFLKAKGMEVGHSLLESSLLDEAREMMQWAAENGCEIPLPVDAVVSKTFAENSPAYNKSLAQIAEDDMILDIGSETAARYVSAIQKAKTIIWNGPLGVFEFPQFSYGTRTIAFAIAESGAFSIAGGGDTLAAIDQYNLNKEMSYISTGGGAFLACLEGVTLPVLAILQERAKEADISSS
ncbi:MAG: phosphoglycerate kinase [Legionellaceae bacterium]|nr:phosphoglycerate kinase [Legionellaceae bacterium]